MNKKTIVIIAVIIFALLVVFSIWLLMSNVKTDQSINDKITNFDECAAAGNRIQESYPARCITEYGQSFVQQIE